jgi:hypothetical protein
MKVRMTQAVDMDSIPDNILKMLRELCSEIEEATRLSYEATATAEINYNSAMKHKLVLEMVNKAKNQFDTAHESLVDVTSVLGSYINILEPQPPNPISQAHNTIQDTLNQLEQKGPESGPDTEPLPSMAEGE